ncbi:MAG TPA: alpha/beta hydrolase fold domain-containing protein [Planctomycetota bacterium]|nr:alpha/beta hydrolase fold domain-containing protein [Planctomycetota bacterium]
MRSACCTLAAALVSAALAGQAPRPPEQPRSGPGGSDYPHAKVVSSVYGKGAEQFWILEPAEPTPRSAPLVVFNHGWIVMQPAVYLGWLHHIVRRGNVVVFPRYQAGMFTPTWQFTRNAIGAVKNALAELGKPGHVAPDLERVAFVGHSAGGAISTDMAALAAAEKLPKPKALMIVQPGRGLSNARPAFFAPAGYGKIPADTLLLVVVGTDDRVVGDLTAKDVFKSTPQIPADRKDFIIVQTDRHGEPPLVADHISPCSPLNPGLMLMGQGCNALDYYAYWKLFDALTDFAFHGKHKEHALGNTPEQRFMGNWSDGTPVKELIVKGNP